MTNETMALGELPLWGRHIRWSYVGSGSGPVPRAATLADRLRAYVHTAVPAFDLGLIAVRHGR